MFLSLKSGAVFGTFLSILVVTFKNDWGKESFGVSESMANVSKIVFAYGGTVFQAAKALAGKKTEESRVTIEHLNNLQTDVELMLKSFNESLIDQLNLLEIQNAFRADERVIVDRLHLFNKTMRMNETKSRDQLLRYFDNVELFNSVKHIVEGMLGQTGNFGTDLLLKIAERTNCHPGHLNHYVNNIMALAKIGINLVDASGFMTKLTEELRSDNQKDLKDMYDAAEKRAKLQIQDCGRDKNVGPDMANFLDRQERGASNSFIAAELYDYLSDKYADKKWIVVVFDHVRNQLSDDYFKALDHKGKSAVAMSYPQSFSAALSSTTAERMQNLTIRETVEETYGALSKQLNDARVVVLQGKNESVAMREHDRNRLLAREYKKCGFWASFLDDFFPWAPPLVKKSFLPRSPPISSLGCPLTSSAPVFQS